MAISDRNSETEIRLIGNTDTVDGCVDYRGRPVNRANSGGWRSAYFIIVVEMAERFAFCGIQSNLITYLTGPLGLSTATAAENVNAWSGTSQMLPLLGAFVADSFLGRYWTIVMASVIYTLGLGLLTLSAMLPSFSSPDCQNTNDLASCSDNQFRLILFFFSLYVVGLGEGGHKPCVQAFGADQFDGEHPEECKLKSSFFNWWYFGMCFAIIFSNFIVSYIEENFNWALGFATPGISMVMALVVFLLGTKSYRYTIKTNKINPFLRVGKVFVTAIRNRRITAPPAIVLEEEISRTSSDQISAKFKFLNKALLVADGSEEYAKVCSISEVEDAKAILRLVPIWTTTLVYGIVFTQPPTFFTKQGSTMDRYVTSGFDIPAASLQSITSVAIVLVLPIYDRFFVPIARSFTRKPSGITMLQRIGTGIFISFIVMAIAALVEMKRLKIAAENGLVDKPDVKIPMSVWWLIPQYALLGVSEAFTMVGLQELFYDQFPIELRSVGLSLSLSILGLGSFLNSFLVSSIETATGGGNGHDSWFANNLNKGHLDYYYWLLAGLSVVGFFAYLHFAKSYIYNNKASII